MKSTASVKSEKWVEELSEKLTAELKGFRHINWGGCGFVASTLAKRLNAAGVEAYVLVRGYCNHGFNLHIHKTLTVQEEVIFDNGCSHALTYIPKANKVIDSDGCYDNRGSGDVISAKAMAEVVREPDFWNDTFDRDQMPKMRRRINKVVDKHVAERGVI